MKVAIIIPAHNEEKFIEKTLMSLLNQTVSPAQIMVVNDHSSDQTESILNKIGSSNAILSYINLKSSDQHLPGAKVVNAFNQGLKKIDSNFDIICKFDADLIFPPNYLENLINHYQKNPKLGMCAGHCIVFKEKEWVHESFTSAKHIRGALKSYRKKCFEMIGGIKPTMGWDTIDELLAQFYGWEIKTISQLRVKHLKPTGSLYEKQDAMLQGKAVYKMRYGATLTLLTALKMAYKRKNGAYFLKMCLGFIYAMKNKTPYVVSAKEGKFFRNHRWEGIKRALF